MSIVSISRIQHRRGLQQDLPQLAAAEFGWSMDEQRLFIGNGPLAEGAPKLGNTEMLTEHSDILQLAKTYTFKNETAGYIPNTGGRTSRFTSVIYGNDLYVAVGNAGNLLTSTDGANWSPIYPGVTTSFNSVCYGNGLYVAVGAGGTIVRSSDGGGWNTASTAIFLTLTSVVYAGGTVQKFIATSNTGFIIISEDANVWSSPIATGVGDSLNSIDFDGSYAVAVGNNGIILLSNENDVSTWTLQTSPTNYNLKSVKYTDQWTITGEYSTVLVSMDATTWTYGYTDTFRAAAKNSTTWVFVGDGGIIYRTNTTDLVISNTDTEENLYDVCYNADDNQFVAVGANTTILTSSSGVTWSKVSTSTSGLGSFNEDINRIIYDSDNSVYVAVCTGGFILTSNDGAVWQIISLDTSNSLYGITVAKPNSPTEKTYIIAAEQGEIYTSNDLSTWTLRSTGIAENLDSVKSFNVGGSNWRTVAVGTNGAIIYSSDKGATWTLSTVPSGFSDDLHNVNYVTWTYDLQTYTKWFAVGNNAKVLSSVDNGQTWAYVENINATNHMFNIYYGLGYFWIIGSVGYSTLYALDITVPSTITPQSLAVVYSLTTGYNGPTLYNSTYGNNYYVIVGQYNSILISHDGQNFVSQTDKTYTVPNLNTSDILSIVYVNSKTKFTAVGNQGFIANSVDAVTWDGFSFNFGTSQTIRTLQSKLDDYVSVKDFGAVGDGVTDDTESINRAMYEIFCRNANPSARKTLYFPGGRYIISNGLNVPTNANLVGEGMNNTIIQQTADPNFVSYVMTTADSLQQIGAQSGLNGAVLPKSIYVSNMALESSYDAVWHINSSITTFERVRMTGGQTNNPGPQAIDGVEYVGVYIIGGELDPPADLNFIDCIIENYNYGVYQPSTEYSRNVIFSSTTFRMMYNAFNVAVLGGRLNTMNISNCVFDLIGHEAIKTNYATNVISNFNSYRDVGNNYNGIGHAVSYIMDFGDLSEGCASINDQFERTYEEAHESGYNYVYGNTRTIEITAGHEVKVGLWRQEGGERYTLNGAETNQATGYSFLLDDNSYNKKVQYSLQRGGDTRTGILTISVNSSTFTYNLDDDSSETNDVGVTFSLSDDGTYVSLDYTSDIGSDIDLLVAESYLDLSW
jgi:photosystem II stability/assembly factor-like uncharacterized protein